VNSAKRVWFGLLIAAVFGLVHGHQLLPAPIHFSWGVTDWTPYIGESIVGVAIALAALWQRRSHATTR
jgi:hypothetical protein